MKFTTQVALLSVATLAIAQPHNHQHRHPVRGTKVARDVAMITMTEVAAGPVQTVYILDGQTITYEEVEEGLKSGKYVLIGETLAEVSSAGITVTGIAAGPSVATTAAPVSSATPKTSAAEFVEQIMSSSASTSVAPSTTSAASTAASSSKASSAAPSSSAVATSSSGDWADFPSGTISCDTFPSEYGAVAASYLGLDSWIGIQTCPDYSTGDSSIATINTVTSGGCVKNSFCSYACPAGYEKSQWPTAQGSTGESVGGLFCNADGMLELTRTSVSQLCTSGAGNVQVTNNLNKVVSVCRTDYPGTESETVALSVAGGSTYDLTVPEASSYYMWEGLFTSAQYYINPSGYDVDVACKWGTAGSNMGNYAPLNAGVGMDATGTTWLSLIPNSPTNPDGTLDYTVTIEGDVSGVCKYVSGTYYNNGVESSSGCTVSITNGGSAKYVFSS